MNLLRFAAAALAAGLLASAPASAEVYQAPTRNGKGRLILLDPLSFLKVEDLKFGAYIIPTTGSGTVQINPLDSGLTFTGTVTPFGTETPQRGWLIGAGDPGQEVSVTAVLPDKLYVDGDFSKPSIDVNLYLDRLSDSNGVYTYTINSGKVFNIYIGGSIVIAAGQAPGAYEGTFEVTATYL